MQNLLIENVQDYPRPPSLHDVPQRLRVVHAGEVVADTLRGLRVLETHHPPTYYIPLEDIYAKLTRANGGSFCEWKGRAQYFDVMSGGKVCRRAAWTYESPTKRFHRISGHVAFYAGLLDACFVGEEAVIPQPGDYYGGWFTPNLLGTPKGNRGTLHW